MIVKVRLPLQCEQSFDAFSHEQPHIAATFVHSSMRDKVEKCSEEQRTCQGRECQCPDGPFEQHRSPT